MHDGSGRIVVQNLTKQFGSVTAVQNLSFVVEPGSVTGFLGPNGAGKTTTLRMLLGLVRPTSGVATINGRPFNQLGNPARVVGAVLEAQSFHPRRTARNHLRVYAAAIGVPDDRVEQVLYLVGLAAAADRKVGGFSLGMRQRLALATALLGDPQVLVLDEPTNGLDPEGIAWLRSFLQQFARSGRTVLISSHLLAEVEQTVDQVVIVSRGQTVYYGPLEQLRASQQSRVLAQPADPHGLVNALREAGLTQVESLPDGRLAISGADSKQVADVALKAGIALYSVEQEQVDLERLFFLLTNGQYAAPGMGPYAQQYAPPGGTPTPPQPGWGPQAGPVPGHPGTGPQPIQQPGHPGTGPQPIQPPAPGYGGQPQPYQQPGYPPGTFQQPGNHGTPGGNA